MTFATPQWDFNLFRLINDGLAHPQLDELMLAASSPAVLFAGLGIALSWALVRTHSKRLVLLAALLLLASMGGADFSSKHTKDLFGRVRPVNQLAEARYHQDGAWQTRPADYTRVKERGTSYPSAHAANTMALAVGLALLRPRLFPWCLALPLITGFSRVYLGKHFPTDVLAGWCLGAAVSCAASPLYIRLREMLSGRLRTRPSSAANQPPHGGA